MTNRLEARHRAEQAAKMSFTGATWQDIADALGYRSRQAAQLAVKRLHDATPAETVEQARARHDGALRLLQQRNFARYLHAVEDGDDDIAIGFSKELRGIVTDRAKMAGVYAPVHAEVDVSVNNDARSIIDRMESELLALIAQREPPSAISSDNIIDAEIEEIR